MKIPKYYLKPFWQAERVSTAKGCTANTVMGLSRDTWDRLRSANNKPELYNSANNDAVDSVDSAYLAYSIKGEHFIVLAWALTKRLKMEEKKE